MHSDVYGDKDQSKQSFTYEITGFVLTCAIQKHHFSVRLHSGM